MVRNVRWLYNKLGTVDISGIGNGTVSSGLNTVHSELDGKADERHTHGVGDLPVSNSQVNSTSHVPSSSVAYSLNTLINELGAEIDEIKDQVASTVIDTLNNTYESKSLGTWNKASDVDTFLSRFNHNSFYSDGDTTLALGNYVTIQDGTYNAIWEIAGFDMEHNQTAADGTVYDNGYGICLIPKVYVTSDRWNTTATTSGGYYSSYMHKTVLPGIVTNLNTVLGDNIVNRNVLLSNNVNSATGFPSSATWTTAYSALMSYKQISDDPDTSGFEKFSNGEASYYLPLFIYEEYGDTSDFSWMRNPKGFSYVRVVTTSNTYNSCSASDRRHIRPMIYIR